MTTTVQRLAAIAAVTAAGMVPAMAADPICFEAETAVTITAPMARVDASDKAGAAKALEGASGDQYLTIPFALAATTNGAHAIDPTVDTPKKDPKGEAKYTFEIPKAGKYFFWCRTWWSGECGNSFTMILDDGKPFTFGQDGTYKRWHWVQAKPVLKQLTLDKGTHTLVVRNREDGVHIDQILFVKDRRYIPVGIEDVLP